MTWVSEHIVTVVAVSAFFWAGMGWLVGGDPLLMGGLFLAGAIVGSEVEHFLHGPWFRGRRRRPWQR